ncbi:MAG: hypothetical protein U9Q68_10900 [Euryarchaeota archaeon]|nr:hypothetical protein [Euryarchaeota archaeon]
MSSKSAENTRIFRQWRDLFCNRLGLVHLPPHPGRDFDDVRIGGALSGLHGLADPLDRRIGGVVVRSVQTVGHEAPFSGWGF